MNFCKVLITAVATLLLHAAVVVAQDWNDKERFAVYGPDGQTYFAEVHLPYKGASVAASSPFLNIIEDARDNSLPGEIEPRIRIDGLSIYGPDGVTPLTWEQARPVIAKSLFLLPVLYEPYPPGEIESHELVSGGDFYLPAAFRAFVSDQWIQQDDKRRAMYAKVFLDLFTAEGFYSKAIGRGLALDDVFSGRFMAGWMANRDLLGKMVDMSENAEMAAWLIALQRAVFSVTAATDHGQIVTTADLRTVIDKVDNRFGNKAEALEWIFIGLDAINSFQDSASRTAVMTMAAQLSVQQLQAEAVVELLRQAKWNDPAILEGAEDALELMKLLEKERFNAFLEGLKSVGWFAGEKSGVKLLVKGVSYAFQKVPYLQSGKVPAGSVGGVVSGLISVGIDTWKTSQKAAYLGCMSTAGHFLASATHQLLSGQSIGDISPAGADIASLVRFNHQSAYLSRAYLNKVVYQERSLSNIIAYTIKDFRNSGLKEILLLAENEMFDILLLSAAVDAAMPGLMDEIEAKYIMPGQLLIRPSTGRTIIAVVDSSGSMQRTDPRRLSIAALNMMIDTLDDMSAMGIVDFDSKAEVLSEPVVMGPMAGETRSELRRVLSGIDAAGGTNIRAGLAAAAGLLGETGEGGIVVLLTDGIDQFGWRGEVDMLPVGVQAHTIAFSDEADQEGLARLAVETGGIADIAHTAEDLTRIVSSIFGAVMGEEVLAVEETILLQGQKKSFDVNVDSGHDLLVAQVSWPGSNVDLMLEDPHGRQYSIKEAVAGGFGVEAATYDIIRIALPVPGTWKAHLYGVQLSSVGETCNLRVVGRQSASTTLWTVTTNVPEAGDRVAIALEGPAEVQWQHSHGEIWLPDGTHRVSSLAISGLSRMLAGQGSIEVFAFTPERSGLYRLRVTVEGTGIEGKPVQRIFERTIRVEIPGKGVRHRRNIDPFIRREPG